MYAMNEKQFNAIHIQVCFSLVVLMHIIILFDQGGFIFLETSTLAEYANCLNACLLLVEAGRIKVFNSGTHVPFDSSPSQRQNELGSYLVREVEIDLSQFSLTLAVADETG